MCFMMNAFRAPAGLFVSSGAPANGEVVGQQPMFTNSLSSGGLAAQCLPSGFCWIDSFRLRPRIPSLKVVEPSDKYIVWV
jgi:hypothetical protein